MSDVTRILSAIERGDPKAADQLLPLVYDELRRQAASRMAREAPGQTLQATALVHEAYLRLLDGEPAHLAPVFAAAPPLGTLDQDAAHRLGRRGEEVAAAVPVLGLLHVHQAEVRLVDQSGGLQCLPGFLLGQLLGRQPAQLVVDQREELIGRLRIAPLDGGEDARDVAQGRASLREP